MPARLTAAVKVRLDRGTRRELERAARLAGVPASQIVRNLIREHLAKLPATKAR
jgi:hypothetical protein